MITNWNGSAAPDNVDNWWSPHTKHRSTVGCFIIIRWVVVAQAAKDPIRSLTSEIKPESGGGRGWLVFVSISRCSTRVLLMALLWQPADNTTGWVGLGG